MIQFDDIYYEIDPKYVVVDFWNLNNFERKELLDKYLKSYLMMKLEKIISKPNLVKKDIDVLTLYKMLADLIPKSEHDNTLVHFIRYFLNLAGLLQEYSISWVCKNNKNLKDNPTVEFNKNGQWDKLLTNPNPDYVKTFYFIYHIFNDVFLLNYESQNVNKVL